MGKNNVINDNPKEKPELKQTNKQGFFVQYIQTVEEYTDLLFHIRTQYHESKIEEHEALHRVSVARFLA